MILTEKQAEKALIRRGPEARQQVIEAFAEYRSEAERLAWINEVAEEVDEGALGVLRARLMARFWRFFERRHASHIKWVESLEATEQGGN